jgi:type II secretion system protein G
MLIAAGVVVLMFVPFHETLRSMMDSVFRQRGAMVGHAKADINALGSALQLYRINTGSFPTTEEGLEALVTRPATLASNIQWTQCARRLHPDPWGRPYLYVSSGSGPAAFAKIYSLGENIKDPSDDFEIRVNAGAELESGR